MRKTQDKTLNLLFRISDLGSLLLLVLGIALFVVAVVENNGIMVGAGIITFFGGLMLFAFNQMHKFLV